MADTKKVVQDTSLPVDQTDQSVSNQANEVPGKQDDQPANVYALDYAPLGEKYRIGGRYIVEGRLVDAEGNAVNEEK